jgi:hypothetical protein
MSKAKLNLNQMSVADKIQFARRVAAQLDANGGVFNNPPQSFETIYGASSALQLAFNDAQSARQQAIEKTTLQSQAEAALDEVLRQTALYVDSVSAGNAATIELAGLAIRNPQHPVGPLRSPEDVIAKEGRSLGEIILRWRSVRGARSYLVEETTGLSPSGPWSRSGVSTKAKAFVDNLTSGNRYWFRVAAIGAAGQGAWSYPIMKIAP